MKKKFFATFVALFASLVLLLGLAACGETLKEYEIKFADESGTELITVTVEKGKVPEYTGETPKKAADAQYTYTFSGWTDGETTYAADKLPAAEKDVTYKAVFTGALNSYTVTWHVESDTSTTTVKYGEKAVYDGTPAKASTIDKTYTFAGWAKTGEGDVLTEADLTITGDAEFYAVFTEATRTYTVKFVNDDGAELLSSQVAYGATPTYTGAAPTKAKTPQYTYTFAGWLDEEETPYGPTDTLPTVEGDATYTAQYTSTVNQYTVTWNIEGTETTATLAYGATPTYTGTPEKDDTTDHSYEFAGWATTSGGTKLETLPTVTGDVTYYAVFNEVTRKYTVTWSIDGNTTTTRVTKGTAPTHTDPTKERTPQYTYTFKGWSTESAESDTVVELAKQTVTQDITYYAVFDKTVNKYTVTFVVEGEEDVSNEIEYGTKPSYGKADPSKEQTVSTTYTFKGWNDGKTTYATADLPEVTEEVTYTAVIEATTRQYTVTIKYYEGLTGGTKFNNMEDETLTLDYGTILNATHKSFEAKTVAGKKYLPNMFRLGGRVTESNEPFIVRYTEADTWDGTSKSASLTGSGTSAEDPFLINSAADLYYLAIDSYNTNEYGKDKYYKLTKSIDLAGHPWQPICYNTGKIGGWIYFAGNFDGAGFTVAGLSFNDASKNGVGLFACAHNGEIKNLTVQGSLTAATRAGGLVYFADGEKLTDIKTFVDITVNGSTGEVYSGGVIGTSTSGTSTFTNLESYGALSTKGKRLAGILGNTGAGATFTFTNCINYSDVTGGTHMSGIVGFMEKSKITITGCVNYGNITATTQRAAGFIATIQGGSSSTITNCTNYGVINTPAAGAGIVGSVIAPKDGGTVSGVSISESKNYGHITGTKQIGGILGMVGKEDNKTSGSVSDITVSMCTNHAEVAGNNHVGGIVGETMTVNVTECTNNGDVKGTMEVGDYKGFAGIVGWTTTSSKVTKCTNHGNVTGNTNTGGICGYLGKGSTCPAEDEDANTNDGKITANSARGDIIGYDANNT